MTDIFTLQHQAVRDLAWLCVSPSLLSHLPNAGTSLNAFTTDKKGLHRWLKSLDAQPQALQQHLSKLRSPRLGIYYEGLCAYFWQHYPGHQLHCQNLQASHEGKTFGEYDFISQSPEALYHVEAAVKFYLGIPANNNSSHSQWQQWIGPNCNDRLDKKLQRLRDHQLQLASTAPGSAALKQQGINPAQLRTALQLQGYLFYPAHSPLAAPLHSHPQHGRGLWYYLADFIKLLNQHANSHWLELDKHLWLSPAVLRNNCDALPLTSAAMAHYLTDYFSNAVNSQHKPHRHRPLLLAQMQEQPQQWQEQQRCFVVPDNWPWGKE